MMLQRESRALRDIEESINNTFVNKVIDKNKWQYYNRSIITVSNNHVVKILIVVKYNCDSCLYETTKELANNYGFEEYEIDEKLHDFDLPGYMEGSCFNNCGLGIVPPSIEDLTELEEFYLIDYNDFWGGHVFPIDFPSTFKSLQSLKNVSLRIRVGNFLPISEVPNLKSLDMESCTLDDASTIKHLNVQKLNLAKLGLYQIPSEWFTSQHKFTDLILSYNRLQELPDSIGTLKHLKKLDLSACGLRKLPESFGNFNSLEILNLSHNNLNVLPESFRRLSSLKELHLMRNFKFESSDEILREFPSLEYIDIPAGIKPRDSSFRGNVLKINGTITEEDEEGLHILTEQESKYFPKSSISNIYLPNKRVHQVFSINLKEYCKKKYVKLYEDLLQMDTNNLVIIEAITYLFTRQSDKIPIEPGRYRITKKTSVLLSDAYNEYVRLCNAFTSRGHLLEPIDINTFHNTIDIFESNDILKIIREEGIEKVKFAAVNDEDRYHDIDGIRDIIREITNIW